MGHIVEPEVARRFTGAVLVDKEPITIGEALEATAFSAANKPVDQIDAAAIQAAEMRATGFNEALPGCVAAAAQAVADLNAGKARDEDKAKLSNNSAHFKKNYEIQCDIYAIYLSNPKGPG